MTETYDCLSRVFNGILLEAVSRPYPNVLRGANFNLLGSLPVRVQGKITSEPYRCRKIETVTLFRACLYQLDPNMRHFVLDIYFAQTRSQGRGSGETLGTRLTQFPFKTHGRRKGQVLTTITQIKLTTFNDKSVFFFRMFICE